MKAVRPVIASNVATYQQMSFCIVINKYVYYIITSGYGVISHCISNTEINKVQVEKTVQLAMKQYEHKRINSYCG